MLNVVVLLLLLLGQTGGVPTALLRGAGRGRTSQHTPTPTDRAALAARRQWLIADALARRPRHSTTSGSAAAAAVVPRFASSAAPSPLHSARRASAAASTFRLASARAGLGLGLSREALAQTETVATVVGGAVAEAVRAQEATQALSAFVSLSQVQYWLVALTALMLLTLTAVIALIVLAAALLHRVGGEPPFLDPSLGAVDEAN
jgi:hypothetical protein